ncbi:hypothetical protein MOP88_14550 [Sphingomonas sp. WKB10]|nr:hypothetical protein [Sphingomonas sp. WKB10]
MRGLLLLGSAMLCCASAAYAETNEALKAKPAKYAWDAAVDTEAAVSCLLENNSLNVQTIKKPGYVDLAMYMSWKRMLLVTITPTAQGVHVEARGQMAKAAQNALPCMGLPRVKGLAPLG